MVNEKVPTPIATEADIVKMSEEVIAQEKLEEEKHKLEEEQSHHHAEEHKPHVEHAADHVAPAAEPEVKPLHVSEETNQVVTQHEKHEHHAAEVKKEEHHNEQHHQDEHKVADQPKDTPPVLQLQPNQHEAAPTVTNTTEPIKDDHTVIETWKYDHVMSNSLSPVVNQN